MHSSIPLAILVTLLSFSSTFAATEYLVVTTDELAPSFQTLADQKTIQGYETEIVTVEQLQLMGVPGRDLAEQIRHSIQTIYQNGSLRFVLLGGDTGVIPARLAYNDFYPADGTEIPTDLYFASLDGDWDANGNSIFAEVGVDAADLDPEVAVGRVPVNNALEASQYVAKVGQYESPSHTAHLGSALFLDEVLFPAGWVPGEPISLDGALFGEEIRAIVQSGPSPLTDERLYENYLDYPGSASLSKQEALAAMNAGTHGLVQHAGHGYEVSMSVGDDLLLVQDALALTNGPHHFILVSPVSRGCAFDQDVILEAFLRNPDGGAVATIGSSRTTFPTVTQEYLRAFHEELFLAGVTSLGEALNAVRSDRAGDAQDNTAQRYTQLGLNLLGDPELACGEAAKAVSVPISRTTRLVMRSAAPNPFNPSVTIRFELLGSEDAHSPVTVSVYDVAGRRIRTLWNGVVAVGPQEMVWNGCDDAGAELSSGAYFAVVEHAGERHATKMTLIK